MGENHNYDNIEKRTEEPILSNLYERMLNQIMRSENSANELEGKLNNILRSAEKSDVKEVERPEQVDVISAFEELINRMAHANESIVQSLRKLDKIV